jgi:hypothetical protein
MEKMVAVVIELNSEVWFLHSRKKKVYRAANCIKDLPDNNGFFISLVFYPGQKNLNVLWQAHFRYSILLTSQWELECVQWCRAISVVPETKHFEPLPNPPPPKPIPVQWGPLIPVGMDKLSIVDEVMLCKENLGLLLLLLEKSMQLENLK